jgi:hypothetical protein
MMDSYIYADLPTPEAIDEQLRLDIMAIDNNFADSSVLLDGWIGLTGEIKAITSILTSFKDTGLTFEDFGNDGANAFSNLMATPTGPAKVETLMLDINGSKLAYPAIPNCSMKFSNQVSLPLATSISTKRIPIISAMNLMNPNERLKSVF